MIEFRQVSFSYSTQSPEAVEQKSASTFKLQHSDSKLHHSASKSQHSDSKVDQSGSMSQQSELQQAKTSNHQAASETSVIESDSMLESAARVASLSTPCLRELSFTIQRGEYVAIIGSNGSGKSTVAKLMNGMLCPTKGEVYIDGCSTQDTVHVYNIRQQVGLVFQNPDNQIVATTVFDDLAFGLENIGFPPEKMDKRIEEVLRRVGMWEQRDVEPHHLSGGQKQRVAIAGILVMRPEVIVFDEATSMLDPQGRKEVLSMMQELHQEGMTIIHITHHMDEVVEASRVLVLQEGKLLRDSTPVEFFYEDYQKTEPYFEAPFIFEAMKQLESYGVSVPRTIHTQKELVTYLCRLS